MATLALTTPAPWALNDNEPGGEKALCPWRLAIDTFREWLPALAIYFAQQKLKGADFEATRAAVQQSLERVIGEGC